MVLSVVRGKLRHPLIVTLPGLLLTLMVTLGLAAQLADHGSTNQTARPTAARSTADGESKLPKITIEALREKALRLKVDQFVTSVTIQPWGDTLYRWTKPVCPLVAGLPRAQGEFVLARISKAAIDARAPLAGRTCQPNLFVVAIGDDPTPLLEGWRAGDRRMFNLKEGGMQAIEEFIHSTRPIRVWYNTYEGCAGGVPAALLKIFDMEVPACRSTLGSRIVRMGSGSDVESAFIVVDGRKMKNVNLEQMADYIAFIGLADVRLDADATSVPSILELFGHEKPPPQGLTRWDRALLYSLYNTSHRSTLEVPEMEITMTRRMVP